MSQDNTQQYNPMPLVKGKTWNSVEKALSLALEHGVSVKGFSHQEFNVAAQNPEGRSCWAGFVKAGQLAPQDVVWAWIPKGAKKTKNSRTGEWYRRPIREWLGVVVNVSGLKPDTEPYFINLKSERGRNFLERLGVRVKALLADIEEKAQEKENELVARHFNVQPFYAPVMEDVDEVKLAIEELIQ